jgi:hypothetical protein
MEAAPISPLPGFEYLYYSVHMHRAACRNQVKIGRAGRYVKPSALGVPQRAYEGRCR